MCTTDRMLVCVGVVMILMVLCGEQIDDDGQPKASLCQFYFGVTTANFTLIT